MEAYLTCSSLAVRFVCGMMSLQLHEQRVVVDAVLVVPEM